MREAVVNLAAIAGNVRTVRAAADGTPMMVVVKANGYGHGAVPAARAAIDGGAEWLGVADLDEARELRDAGIRAPVLAWLHADDADFAAAAEAGIDVGISYPEQLEAAAASPGLTRVHLKLDTGLNRNGVPAEQWEAVLAVAAEHQRAGRIVVIGIFSHVANAGAQEDMAQAGRFAEGLAAAHAAGLEPEVAHLAATAAALSVPESRFGLLRVGIGAYGLSPLDDSPIGLGLTPAMELAASVVAVKRAPAGSGVSYGHEYRTTAETTLALVPLGYADGVPRQASGRGPVWINGTTYPVAGRIAMDQLVVDVGDDPVWVGDRAVLFGDPANGYPSATEWAVAADTINYDIVTKIGNRVRRRYLP